MKITRGAGNAFARAGLAVRLFADADQLADLVGVLQTRPGGAVLSRMMRVVASSTRLWASV
jgi:hypothetical protein